MAPRTLLKTLLALAFLVFPSHAAAQGIGSTSQTKENLDLPYDAIGEGSEEEIAPDIIQFYGQNYEGDGIFYVIDRSGSMQGSGELDIAKREVTRNIAEFSSRVQFGIVFFDVNILKYPSSGTPVDANSGQKQGAIGWVMGVPGGGGSCVMQGMTTGLKFANKASVQRRVLIYVGDGGGTCKGADENQYHKQTLAIIKGQNYNKAQINCVGVLSINDTRRQFMQALCRMNSGTYTEIKR